MVKQTACYLICLMLFSVGAFAQRSAWVAGVGLAYTAPTGEWASVANNAFALQAGIQWRRYSNLWFGVSGQFLTKGPTPVGQDSTALAEASFFIEPEVRWFIIPAKATSFPVYIRAGGMISHMPIDGVSGNANGIGLSGGIGVLIYYPTPDADVFLDGYVRWMAPNIILRNEARAIFTGVQGGLTLSFRL